jgi:hypothetical protein
MARKKGPYVKDRRIALVGGYVGVAAGAWLLYDAYERRGRSKPFIAKMVPGA